MSRNSDWRDRHTPVLSRDFLLKFLAYVHPFSDVGLEAQCAGFSNSKEGVIQYLGLLPQVNTVSRIQSAEGNPNELDAATMFCDMEHLNDGSIFQRCWIHTYPRYPAYMSSLDLIQLYSLRLMDDNSFGIVISPREKGVKLLCVHLTDEGFVRMRNWNAQTGINFESYVSTRLSNSFGSMNMYCQIPFELDSVPTKVLDLRTREETGVKLRDFVASGQADIQWIPQEPQ